MNRLKNGVVLALMALAAGGLIGHATPAAATPIDSLSFSGATWSDGGKLSGSFTYEYNSSFNVTIDSVNILSTAGSQLPTFDYVYALGGAHNTISTPGTDYQNTSAKAYELFVSDAATGNVQMFLDWTGLGSSAQIKISIVGGNYSSEDNGNCCGSTILRLTSAGTSVASTVPEPFGAGVLLIGMVGVGWVRRRAA